MKRESIKNMILCALFAAVISVFSIITIPIGPVPVSMSVFAIMLTGMLLEWKMAAAAVSVYILIGCAGLPVFSGFRGGLAVLIGPTGGFILSYVLMATIISLISAIAAGKKYMRFFLKLTGALLGLVVCYFFGTLQFSLVMKTSFEAALAVCVYPFVLFDIMKALAAAFVALSVINALPSYFQQKNRT